MAITDIPILSMLRTKLTWSQERQKVLAENIANSDTPNYRARDLAPPKFEDPTMARPRPMGPVTLVRTEAGHIAGQTPAGSLFGSETRSGVNVSPTGNSVNLEDEMLKVAANQMDYQAATAIYSRSLGLIKVGLGKR